MKTCTPPEQKTKLQSAIKSALKVANEEMDVLGSYYKEENLRYIVMSKISSIECFGVFPNINGKQERKLCFQTEYNGGDYNPDIVSLCFTKDGSPKKNNPLVIELKTNASKTELKNDLDKAHHYLKKVGDMKFGIAVVLTIGVPNKNTEKYINELNEVLREHRNKLKRRSEGKNLLFAWYNPLSKKPECFWLDQKAPFSLYNKKYKS